MLRFGVIVPLLATAGLLLISHSEAACTDGNSTTCNDHGTCDNNTCNCTSGYDGTNCETTPLCTADANCTNGGSCNTIASPYSCDCATGYTGDTCDTRSGSVQVTFIIKSLLVTTFLSVLLK